MINYHYFSYRYEKIIVKLTRIKNMLHLSFDMFDISIYKNIVGNEESMGKLIFCSASCGVENDCLTQK